MDGCIVMVVMIPSTMKRSVTNLQSRKQKLQRNKSSIQTFFEAPYPEQKHNEEPGVVYTFRLNDDLENGFEN